MKGLRGTVVTTGAGSPTGGTGNPAQAALGVHGGPVGDGSFQRPGITTLVAGGALPRRRSLLNKRPLGDGNSQWPRLTS